MNILLADSTSAGCNTPGNSYWRHSQSALDEQSEKEKIGLEFIN